ncbi:hypothetical protein KP509_15G064800 [Ceratopteris richardii]|nr:hypothetical protein KP509_15G064800 [Ceratopteris richardii]
MVRFLLSKPYKVKFVKDEVIKMDKERRRRPRFTKSLPNGTISKKKLDAGAMQIFFEIRGLRLMVQFPLPKALNGIIFEEICKANLKSSLKERRRRTKFRNSVSDGKASKKNLIVDRKQVLVERTDVQEACKGSEETQKAEEVVDKSYIPGLPDAVALLCLAYLPLAAHRSLALVSQRHRELVRESLLMKLRRQHQIDDQWICIYASGNDGWSAFNPRRNMWRSLPHANVDPNFVLADKESLAAGPHLLWLGRETYEFACYKYDLEANSWESGPRMVNPRCLFGSASCGRYAYVAGGFSVGEMQFDVLNSAERYDSLTGTWTLLPPMHTPRHKCSGFFMDGKFYVIGGKTANHEQLTSGEEFDPANNTWRTIENMYSVPLLMPSIEPSPPLVAVAGNELYAIESATNLLKVYEKSSNTWRVLGSVPVRADFCNGWGLAFKALDDHLFVIGGHRYSSHGAEGVAVFSWKPQPGAMFPEWQLVNSGFRGSGSFLFNCAVMSY